MLIALLVPLALAILVVRRRSCCARRSPQRWPSREAIVLGAVTNFFDTLGIGSFAPTMAWFKFRKLVPDRLIPPTMLVGHSLPTMAQAFIFLILLGVLVDPVLLVGCAIALLLGGLVGAPLVAQGQGLDGPAGRRDRPAGCGDPLRHDQPRPDARRRDGRPACRSTLTIVAIVANFVFGILLNFGVGNYAPTLVMLSLMGMDPRLVLSDHGGGGGADRRRGRHAPHR